MIVGAGPIGLMTANLLGLSGLQVAVFERNRGLVGLPRAIAYDAETLRLFAQVGLFEEIAPGLVRDPHVRHLNARGKALMSFQVPAEHLRPFAAWHLLSAGFREGPAQGTVSLRTGRASPSSMPSANSSRTRAASRSAVSTTDGPLKVRAAYVVACDGGTSRVREQLGVKLSARPMWSVGLWSTRSSKTTTSRNHLHLRPAPPARGTAGGRDRVRWEFMQLPGESEEELKSDDNVRALVGREPGSTNSKIERKAIYTFHARVADRWRVNACSSRATPPT